MRCLPPNLLLLYRPPTSQTPHVDKTLETGHLPDPKRDCQFATSLRKPSLSEITVEPFNHFSKSARPHLSTPTHPPPNKQAGRPGVKRWHLERRTTRRARKRLHPQRQQQQHRRSRLSPQLQVPVPLLRQTAPRPRSPGAPEAKRLRLVHSRGRRPT